MREQAGGRQDEASVRESAITFCIFLSKGALAATRMLLLCSLPLLLLPHATGYFASKNCRRELYAALDAAKPILTVHETDENKGGASLATMMQSECADSSIDWDGGTADDIWRRVVGTRDRAHGYACDSGAATTTWVRVSDFQKVSLRELVAQMLHTIGTDRFGRKVARACAPSDLHAPGEQRSRHFLQPVRLLFGERRRRRTRPRASQQRAAAAAEAQLRAADRAAGPTHFQGPQSRSQPDQQPQHQGQSQRQSQQRRGTAAWRSYACVALLERSIFL